MGEGGDDERRISLLLGLARSEHFLGRTERAEEWLRKVAGLFEKGAFESLQSARILTEAVLCRQADAERAHSLFEASVEAARRAKSVWDETDALRAWLAYCEERGDSPPARNITAQLSELRSRRA